MDSDGKIVVFEGKKIRKAWHRKEWWFVVEDIVVALTNSNDPKQYINKMRQRDEPLSEGWVQIVHTLPVETVGGVQKINCTNTEGAFRIIQSIPSPRAEPFKLWLAKVGYERVQEIEDPERAQMRMKQLYRAKGYSDEWIEKRIRGIAVRQELTEEWDKRGAEKTDYSILTDEITKATFDMTAKEYKQFKGLEQENLRDHMDDIELILTMLGEATTTRFTRDRDSQKLPTLKRDAKDGGEVAGATRKDIETKLGKKVVSNDNYLRKPEKQKRLERR
jgi:prophage antirepressor-like protein